MSPALSWDAVFNMKKVQVELIPFLDMFIFFEKDIRVSVSYICNRYSKVNNKYLKFYVSKQESKYNIQSNTNSLYSYAIPKFLITRRIKQIYPKEFNLNKYISNSSIGCVLEGDLEHPKELRQLHNYPLALDTTEIKRKMLCNYQ